MTEKVDKLGALASTICAIHCAVCALLPAALGALGIGFLVGHEAEWVFTLIAVAFASIALLMGWRQHQSIRVAGLLTIGIVGLLASRAIEMGSGHHGHEKDAHSAAHVEAGHPESKAAARAKADGHKEDGHKGDGHKENGHKTDGHKTDGNGDGHKDGHGDEHEGMGHMMGTLVGVLGGLLLLMGHIFNIRETRRSQ